MSIYDQLTFNFNKDLNNKNITINALHDLLHEFSMSSLRTKEIQIKHYVEDLLHTKRGQKWANTKI